MSETVADVVELALSDEEVADEYREDGEDVDVVASRVRGILSAAVDQSRGGEGG